MPLGKGRGEKEERGKEKGENEEERRKREERREKEYVNKLECPYIFLVSVRGIVITRVMR